MLRALIMASMSKNQTACDRQSRSLLGVTGPLCLDGRGLLPSLAGRPCRNQFAEWNGETSRATGARCVALHCRGVVDIRQHEAEAGQ